MLFLCRWHNKWPDHNLTSGASFGPKLAPEARLGFLVLLVPLAQKWPDHNLAFGGSFFLPKLAPEARLGIHVLRAPLAQ